MKDRELQRERVMLSRMIPRSMIGVVVALLGGLMLSGPAHAQNRPFPQHVTYTAGSIKPGLPQTTLDQTVRTFYDAWKARYLVNGCHANQYYVFYSFDYTPNPANAITVSEAHGYGMMITALMAGYDPNARTYFDGMYRYFTNHFSSITPYLMNWQQITGCVSGPYGNDSATDGDLDIAYALVLADRQWGSGGAINYLAEARKVMAALLKGSINTNVWSVRLGDWTSASHTGTRPSDFMPDHFRSFQRFSGNTNWTRVVDKGYQIIGVIQTNNSPATGLIPDFVVNVHSTPTPAPANYLESATDSHYSYNACRVPWRLGTDYLVSGDARALTALHKLNGWIRTKTAENAANVRAGYNLTNGNQLVNYSDLAFTAPFAVGAMVNASNQVWLNKLWTNINATAISSGSYYGNTIKLLSLLVLSGNWWTPALQPPAITNHALLPNGHFFLHLISEPQFTNQIQATTNFVNWTTLLTTNPPAAVAGFNFTDPQAGNFPRRFYRGLRLP